MNMVRSSYPVGSQGQTSDRVARLIAPKNIGWYAIITAGLTTLAVYVLQISFLYPAILNEKAAITLPLFQSSSLLIAAALGLLAIAGLLNAGLAYGLAQLLPARLRTSARLIGVGAGLAQAVANFSWLIAGPLLAQAFNNPASRPSTADIYQIFKSFYIIVGLVAANYMLAFWLVLVSLAWFKTRRWFSIVGLIAAVGWFAGALKALAWVFGLNLTASYPGEFDWNWLLATFETVGISVWLVWLVWLGLGLIRTAKVGANKGEVQ